MAAKGVGITNQFKKKEEESNMNGGLSDMYPMNNYN
jgi:hypothetical protein